MPQTLDYLDGFDIVMVWSGEGERPVLASVLTAIATALRTTSEPVAITTARSLLEHIGPDEPESLATNSVSAARTDRSG